MTLAKFDRLTGADISIDYAHHEIHAGSSFSLNAIKEAMADGDTFTLTCTTPDSDKELHVLFAGIGLYEYYLKVFRDPTITTSGTPATPINMNENSTKTSDATFTVDDTISDLGTPVFESYVASGLRVGGAGEIRAERILKRNTTYVFYLESDKAANILTGILDWYEHTPITLT